MHLRMQEPTWNIDVYDDGTTLYVTPVGELDVYTAPQLAAALSRLTDSHRALILEVAELTFVDSTGLKVLTDAAASGARALHAERREHRRSSACSSWRTWPRTSGECERIPSRAPVAAG